MFTSLSLLDLFCVTEMSMLVKLQVVAAGGKWWRQVLVSVCM
ncbi:hypothetical protein HanRHA438_Chr10g0436621 [Helianthus annuus]|nr:hypothetical protein HanOQP8_Chr10g0352921 [Helianthus annuus]KAJ0878166.1 hypothetical protein HanRHA438_Chr10g0436621 [Helianthus annuus]KAJ0882441.1 hypothetical protein HanPSC8_Chr10g0409691 [Helianthus annuus]